MDIYSKILVAIDLNDEADPVTDKALALAKLTGAKLHFLHVTEPLSYAYGGDIPLDFSGIQQQLHDHAKQRFDQYLQDKGIADHDQTLTSGNIESEIHRVALDIEADLIMLGSHGRHGLALLLGSTSNGVLHGATCDVLAVHV